MKLLLIFALFVTVQGHDLSHLKSRTDLDTQKVAVEKLISRILPNRIKEFSVIVDGNFTAEGLEIFKINKVEGVVTLTGSTGVAAATALNYYLKYYCNVHISWELSQLNLPTSLPDVNATESLNDQFRYYQNVCTTSYSFVWWDWSKWEEHIDWMVLNSFNFVLAFNGQEAIWDRIYRKLNMTDAEIDEQFSGPAFLSWLRMGNIRGWGGPLSSSWHERSLELQHKILDRMRAFGIITILPGFAGQLPRAFERLYPNVNMTKMSDWNEFPDKYCCPYLLDPTEELFETIGKMFIEEQIAEYGTDHVYNCDSFNEMNPASTDLTYLSNVAKSIYKAMTAADPDAIWLMQGWLFVHSFFFWTYQRARALLTSVPKGKMIVLDLQSEQFPQYQRLDQYFGQPYIWCMLHNFGGTLGMYGSADIINTNVIAARTAVNSTMIGTGLTMEGINQNYVIYDLMTEQAWRKSPVDLGEWFKLYARRRYGKEDEIAETAWTGFLNTLYSFSGIQRMRGQYPITKTPSLNIDTWTWYDYEEFFNAWKQFLNASDSLGTSPGYLHDLVDLTRQLLQNNGNIYYDRMVDAFQSKNISAFENYATIYRGILLDLESILATNKAFLLGNWLEAAKSCANSSEELKLFEFDARNQITLWGPWGQIMNYAIKQWSGLVKDFLYPRWDEFIYALNVSLVTNTTFSEDTEKAIIFVLYEEPFVFATKTYPTEPSGDTIEISKVIGNRTYYFDTSKLVPLKSIGASRMVLKMKQKVKRGLKNRRAISRLKDLDQFGSLVKGFETES